MPDQQDKNEQLIFDLDAIIAEVRRPGWTPPSTPGVAMPKTEPKPEAPAPQPEPEAPVTPEPAPEAEPKPAFPLPENVEELAAHFAPDRPEKNTKKARQDKKNRRREEKELEKQRRAEELEAERKNAAAARKAAQRAANGEYIPRRMKDSPEPESQRLYREAMEQYGAPDAPKRPAKKAPQAKAKAEPAPEKPKRRRIPYDRFRKPYNDPAQGYADLQEAMLPLSFSVILQGVVLLVALYLTLATYYPLPLPAGFTYGGYTLLYTGILLGLQVLSLILSWEVLRAGLWRLLRLLPTLDSLASLAMLAAIAHSILVLCRPVSLGSFFPLAVPAIFLGFWSTAVKRKRIDELRRRYKVAAMGAAPLAVKLTEDRPRVAVKTTANAYYDPEDMSEPDRPDRAAAFFAPPALVLCTGLALWRTWGAGRPELIPWGLSLLYMAAACPALMSAGATPIARASKWLYNSGAALLNHRTARELAKADQILLRDGDIFPNDQVTVKGLKLADDADFNRVLTCAASITAHIGGGLDKCISDFARQQYLTVRPADEFELYDRGGVSAMLGGDSILMGSYAFLKRMGVHSEEGAKVPHGIFLAINSRFCAVFELSYKAHLQPHEAFTLIRRARLRPLLATLDFSLSPLLLEARFHLKPDWCIWPELQERFDLHEPDWGKETETLALLNRDSALPFAEAVLAARKTVKVARSALVWGLLAALGGMGLMYMMVSGAKNELATPLSLLAYHLLWLVPVYLQSWLNIRK